MLSLIWVQTVERNVLKAAAIMAENVVTFVKTLHLLISYLLTVCASIRPDKMLGLIWIQTEGSQNNFGKRCPYSLIIFL